MMGPDVIKNIRRAWEDRHNPEEALFLVDLLWHVVLAVLLGSLILFTFIGAWMFFSINNKEAQVNARQQSGVLDAGALSNVLGVFEARKNRYEFLKNNPPSLADPS